MGNVYYKRRIEGVTVAGIIKNGNYYYVDIPVYEDGSLDCWERCSLEEFKQKLAKRWVVPQVPVGSRISIFQLGAFQIEEAEFLHNEQTYYQYMYQTVKTMNSELVGLFQESRQKKELWKKCRRGWSAVGIPYKVTK